MLPVTENAKDPTLKAVSKSKYCPSIIAAIILTNEKG